MPSLDPKAFLRPLLAFAVAYGVLALAAWQLGMMLSAEKALASSAANTMNLVGDGELSRTAQVEQRGDGLEYSYTIWIAGEAKTAHFMHPYHAQNLILFLALVLASPGLKLRQRAISLAAGLAAVYALDVLIVMGDFWSVEERHFQVLRAHPPIVALLAAASTFRTLHPTGGAFMLPVFLWGFILLGPYRRSVLLWLEKPSSPRATGC